MYRPARGGRLCERGYKTINRIPLPLPLFPGIPVTTWHARRSPSLLHSVQHNHLPCCKLQVNSAKNCNRASRTMGPNEQNQHFAELRQKFFLYIHIVVLLTYLPSLDGKLERFVTKKWQKWLPNSSQTDYRLGLSSIPAVSMDRWRSPCDNRYARNAGVSIRYKK